MKGARSYSLLITLVVIVFALLLLAIDELAQRREYTFGQSIDAGIDIGDPLRYLQLDESSSGIRDVYGQNALSGHDP